MEKFVLAPYVRIFATGDTGYYSVGSLQKKITEPIQWKALVSASIFAKKPRTKNELRHFFFETMDLENDSAEQCWDILSKNLIREGIYKRDEAMSRMVLYYNLYDQNPKDILARLSNAHVVILGCGGIGNHISYLDLGLAL